MVQLSVPAALIVVVGLLFTGYCIRPRSRVPAKNIEHEDALALVHWYERMYSSRQETIDGQVFDYRSFDGGQKWYQVSIRPDGLSIWCCPDKEAQAVFVRNIRKEIRNNLIINRRDDLIC